MSIIDDAVKRFLFIGNRLNLKTVFTDSVQQSLICVKNSNPDFLQVWDRTVDDSPERTKELNELWKLALCDESSVRGLDISQLGMTPEQIDNLFKHLNDSEKLEFLKVCSSTLKKHGMMQLWQYVKQNHTLKILECESYNVNRYHFSKAEIEAMISALKENTKLEKLFLPDNEVLSSKYEENVSKNMIMKKYVSLLSAIKRGEVDGRVWGIQLDCYGEELLKFQAIEELRDSMRKAGDLKAEPALLFAMNHAKQDPRLRDSGLFSPAQLRYINTSAQIDDVVEDELYAEIYTSRPKI